jgi:DNA-binding MarR family transcriptional regulator
VLFYDVGDIKSAHARIEAAGARVIEEPRVIARMNGREIWISAVSDGQGSPLSLGDLARAEQVRPPTMTRIVTGLETDGLVERKGDLRDRRLTLIHATPKGRRILAAGRARRVEKLASAVRRLDKRELAELKRGAGVLQRVVADIGTQTADVSKL